MVTDSKFAKKKTTFNDLKDVVISDVVELRRKGSLPTIESKSIHKKLKCYINGLKLPENQRKTKTFNHFRRLAGEAF